MATATLAAPLDARVRSALADTDALPVDLSRLADEAQRALQAADRAATEARDRLLDPRATDDALAAAKAAAEAAALTRDRMERAAAALGDRAGERRAEIAEAKRKKDHAAIVAERDEIAELIKTRYPGLATQLVAIASRLRSNNDEIRRARRDRLGAPIESADAVARGRGDEHWPDLDRGLRLPGIKASETPAWPPAGLREW